MGPVIAGVAALLLSVVMPALLLSPIDTEVEEPRVLVIETEAEEQKEMTVSLQTGQGIEELPLEEYLIGVVLSEMPMSFETEALKAQAVAARTFAVGQMNGGKHRDFDLCGQSSCCQAWAGQEVLKDKLGNSWLQCWSKAKAAVKSTAGQVMTYNGELIDAVYFSCSGGKTEDAVAVWGGEVPYLQSVNSPGEEQSGKFYTEVKISREDFISAILAVQPEARLNGRTENWLGTVKRTEGDGVEEMTIGGCLFKGTDLRALFNLNSTNFSLSVKGNELIFEVYGYGHRVGMSQYGANAMAETGRTCDEILQHYYKGIKIQQWQ